MDWLIKFVVWRQRVPFQTSLTSTIRTLVPTPTLSSLPNSSDVRPLKFVLSSSKRIAAWFGVTCKDCLADTIWGCYVTKSCWKVVIVALGVVFLFIAFLMSLFFLGQIDDLLKYQRQLADWEKSYPTLSKLMISPLKFIHKAVSKTYNNTMRPLINKFGSKPWFKFIILWPCTCLKGTWTMFQKILQPTCLFCCTVTSKVKKCIKDTSLTTFTKKKIGIKADPIGDAKRKKKLEKKATDDAKQARMDAKQAKKQAKIDTREAQKMARDDAKQARIDEKREKLDAKQEAKQEATEAKKQALGAKKQAMGAKKEAKQEAFEAREKSLEDKKEAKLKAREVALEAKEVVKETKKAAIEKDANGLNVHESPSPPMSPPPPPPSPIPPMAIDPPGMPSIMSMAPLEMPLVPPNNTMASPIVLVAPFGVFITPPTILNRQSLFRDSPQQFFASAYGDPIQQSATDLYGTMTQQYASDPYRVLTRQYALDPYRVSTPQYATDLYIRYGAPAGQTQGQVYEAYNNPIYINEQYGIYDNGPLYGQQGGFGQTQQGNFGQFQELGSLSQAQQQEDLAQVQYGATTGYGHDPNTTNTQQYYGEGYYSQ